MRKKGFIFTSAIIAGLILIVTLVILLTWLYFSPASLGRTVKGTFFGLTGAEYVEQSEEKINYEEIYPNSKRIFDDLSFFISSTKNNGDNMCYTRHDPLVGNFEEGNFIRLSNFENNLILILGNKDDKGFVKGIYRNEIPDLIPCVIDADKINLINQKEYLSLPKNLAIDFEYIALPSVKTMILDKEYNLNEMYLYKLDKNRVCFFMDPTYTYWTKYEDLELDGTNIEYLNLRQCGTKKEYYTMSFDLEISENDNFVTTEVNIIFNTLIKNKDKSESILKNFETLIKNRIITYDFNDNKKSEEISEEIKDELNKKMFSKTPFFINEIKLTKKVEVA